MSIKTQVLNQPIETYKKIYIHHNEITHFLRFGDDIVIIGLNKGDLKKTPRR